MTKLNALIRKMVIIASREISFSSEWLWKQDSLDEMQNQNKKKYSVSWHVGFPVEPVWNKQSGYLALLSGKYGFGCQLPIKSTQTRFMIHQRVGL